MKVIEFARKMCDLGLERDEVRIIENDEIIHKTAFNDIVYCDPLITYPHEIIRGVSMLETSQPMNGTREYLTMISI